MTPGPSTLCRQARRLGGALLPCRAEATARVTAVLCLFQGSPIPNPTLSQDTEGMAWTTG